MAKQADSCEEWRGVDVQFAWLMVLACSATPDTGAEPESAVSAEPGEERARVFSDERPTRVLGLANGFDRVHFNGELQAETLVDAALVEAADLALVVFCPARAMSE
jgi:hypothetical protein